MSESGDGKRLLKLNQTKTKKDYARLNDAVSIYIQNKKA